MMKKTAYEINYLQLKFQLSPLDLMLANKLVNKVSVVS